jgi:uncharacterized protein (TIGR02444 family)
MVSAMVRDDAAVSFWRFSLMVYARAGVAEALISLQDRGGHNVNLILFGLWLAVCDGRRLDAATLARAKTALAPVERKVVAPLRALRRALKGDFDADIEEMRRRVLALELAAERRAQARLAASLVPRHAAGSTDRAAADVNLQLILGADFASPEADLIRQAIAAA